MDCKHNDSLGRLIYFTAQDIKNLAEKVLKPFGLTLEQFHILKNMSSQTGLSQRELGEIVNKTPANITRLLDRLESKSLITRRDNPDDRRASLVFLTDAGESLRSKVFGTLESFSMKVSQGINEQEQEIVKKVLNKMAANIKTMSENFET